MKSLLLASKSSLPLEYRSLLSLIVILYEYSFEKKVINSVYKKNFLCVYKLSRLEIHSDYVKQICI